MLLLGGLSQWADQWWDVGYGDLLADRFRLIAVDRLGHGDSDKPHETEPYDERLIVEDLLAVLDAEDAQRALVWVSRSAPRTQHHWRHSIRSVWRRWCQDQFQR